MTKNQNFKTEHVKFLFLLGASYLMLSHLKCVCYLMLEFWYVQESRLLK